MKRRKKSAITAATAAAREKQKKKKKLTQNQTYKSINEKQLASKVVFQVFFFRVFFVIDVKKVFFLHEIRIKID